MFICLFYYNFFSLFQPVNAFKHSWGNSFKFILFWGFIIFFLFFSALFRSFGKIFFSDIFVTGLFYEFGYWNAFYEKRKKSMKYILGISRGNWVFLWIFEINILYEMSFRKYWKWRVFLLQKIGFIMNVVHLEKKHRSSLKERD